MVVTAAQRRPDAAGIGHALLPHFARYNREKDRKHALEVIAKIPRADQAAFLALLQRTMARNRDDDVAEDFAVILLTGTVWFAGYRDFPDAMIRLAEARFCLTETEEFSDFYSFDLEMEHHFGSAPAAPTRAFLRERRASARSSNSSDIIPSEPSTSSSAS